MRMNKRGMLIVFSGPSGCGKGTVLKSLFARRDDIRYSVSVTTRAPRDRRCGVFLPHAETI